MYKQITPPYGNGQWGGESSTNLNINGGTTQANVPIIINGSSTPEIIPNMYADIWVKDFRITLNMIAATPTLVYWALVYVPEGYSPNTLSTISGIETYTPNRFAIMTGCFIANTDSQPEVRFTNQFRKLAAVHRTGGTAIGDAIRFICLSPNSGAAYSVVGTVNYKVKSC